jgi:hypothetical protein
MKKSRVLVFTDSRGQHVPVGDNHKVYALRLQEEFRHIQFDLILCPMKWTTILDFIEYSEEVDLSVYDWVVLHCGIVDWSPRPFESAFNDVYNNKNEANKGRYFSNTRDYAKKIINNKKIVFDQVFGEQEIREHLSTPYKLKFQGSPTINMYSLEMALKGVIPRLQKIKNLIFINSNKFVSGWGGDHKKGRPANMAITYEYSLAFSRAFPKQRIVDLLPWTDSEIMKYTCDNIHLTKTGNEYIYQELITKMGLLNPHQDTRQRAFSPKLERDFARLLPLRAEKITAEVEATNYLEKFGRKNLASLVIGFRFSDDAPERILQLEFLLKWIDHFYGSLFDVLLVEQDTESRLAGSGIDIKHYVRHQFVFNPDSFNRGWGYNVAVKHFCPESPVIVLMDIDILPGEGFLADILACANSDYDVVSPYQNVYDTDPEEAERVCATMDVGFLAVPSRIRRPVTICGGILIIQRELFLSISGFEQYTGYSCEDRAMDVTILAACEPSRIKISPRVFAHLYHPTDKSGRKNFKEIYRHLTENYGCYFNPDLRPTEFIHSYCSHVDCERVIKNARCRDNSFGDINLYRSGKELAINGLMGMESENRKVILPPEFSDLLSYEKKEFYDAIEPDASDLSKFYNAYLGKRCFIIGNGPSLNKHDLSLLDGEYTFAVNGIFYKSEETGFMPYFYVVEDSSVMKENIEKIKAYKPRYKFFPTIYKSLHPKDDTTVFFRMNRGFYEKSSPNYAVPRFSTDATRLLYCGQSVTFINLQLAYFMGFSEVYLIGMDFNYVIPQSHERKGDVLLSDTDDENHFHPDYFGKGKTWKDPKLDRVKSNYKMAKLAFESTGRKIYNASVGGKLEVFDRVDYSSLFLDVKLGVRERENFLASTAAWSAAKNQSVEAPMRVAKTSLESVVASARQPLSLRTLKHIYYPAWAESIREGSPSLFKIGRFFMWGLRRLTKHPRIALSLAVIAVIVSKLIEVGLSLLGYSASSFVLVVVAFGIGAMVVIAVYAWERLAHIFELEKKARQNLKFELLREVRKSADRISGVIQAHKEATHHRFAEIHGIQKQAKAELDANLFEANKSISEAGEQLRAVFSAASVFNYGDFQRFNRKLKKEHVDELVRTWGGKLGINPTPKSLAYMAHRISTIEGLSRGRLATSIEAAVLRTLVVASLKSDNIRILEIGSLFGIGLSMIYDHIRPRYRSVHMIAIDPLDGYYGKDVRDLITDEPICELTFRANLAAAGVPQEDYTLVKALSTQVEVVELSRSMHVDVLIIDGDHSYAGVKFDFENYLDAIKPGGFVIFDDYGAAGWPDVQAFVDAEVRSSSRVDFIGYGMRTAVFRVL